MSRSNVLVAAAGIAGSVFSVAMADVAVPGGEGLDRLRAMHPGVRTLEDSGRITTIFGVPMTSAGTDGEAIAQFLGLHQEAFGFGPLQLELSRVNATQGQNKTVYVFSQVLDGLPVEGSRVKVVTHNEVGADAGGNLSTVVLASARVAARPEGGFAADTVTSEQAVARVRQVPRFAALDTWSQPEMVVFFGFGDVMGGIEAVRAWKFTGEKTAVDGQPAKHTFFVNASTNEIEHVRNDILHIDITGNVQAWVSPNNTADHAGNPPALRNMSEVLVRVQGQPATTVRTDRNGNFTIPWAGSTPVTLEVGTNLPGANGLVQQAVVENGGASDVYTTTATPGTPVNIQMNPSSGRTEVTTAEVNALHYLTVTRNYMQDLAPSFAAQMDTIQGNGSAFAILPANVQVAGTCNAFYNGVSTNYYPVGGSCNNTAFASVINHEYGHHIVNRLGLAQNGFGEGYGDTMSILINDDPVIGRFFLTNGGVVRNPDTAGQNFPCNGAAIHTCGMLLGDLIIELRRALGNRYGSAPGLAIARQIHADWSLITGGGDLGLSSAHPETIVDMITVDDDDAIFCNGSPNRDQIVAAANIKLISPIPGIEGRLSVLPLASNPTNRLVGQSITVGATATNAGATLTPGSARLRYRHSGGNAFYTVAMNESSPGVFQADIPPAHCGQRIEYTFVFGSSQGDVTLPNACTGGTEYAIDIVNPNPLNTPFYTNTFETAEAGWTTSGTGLTGQWVRADPIGTAAQPESGTVGVNCWFTGQGTAGGSLGEADVDGGTVILTSPAFNLSGQGGYVVAQYDRWFSNGEGATPYTDVFRVEVSNDNGATWRPGETIGPANSPDTNPGWRVGQAVLAFGGLPNEQVRVRFTAQDLNDGSLIEAAIDNLRFASQPCGCNDVDFNNDSSVFDPADIDDYLSVFSEGPCSTGNCDSIDFNNDGSTFDPQDIDAFLSVFSEGPCIQ